MLPNIDVPTYDIKLPSNGQTITVRPFLVKEEKILLMAVKSDDAQEIIKATMQVINNCIISPEIKIETLPFFDIDYMFIALRAKSIGESIDVNFLCKNDVEGNKCGGRFVVPIDISNVAVENNDKTQLDIKFHDDLIFKMKYPPYSAMKQIDEKAGQLDSKIQIIMACVDKIFTKGQYFTNKDFTPAELQNFIEGLTQQQFSVLEKFIANFPSFYAFGSGKCLKCGKEHSVRYKDFINFFR